MPLGREIHFGFTGPDAIYKLIEDLNLPIIDWRSEEPISVDDLRGWKKFDIFDFDTEKMDAFNATLLEAYLAIAERLGWTRVENKEDHYTTFETPFGKRQTSAFALCLQYDEDEVGDEPEDASIGINLSSRYYPCILDVKNPHGTIGNTVDFDALAPQVQICREEIVKRLPAFADAKVFFREIFY